jgi:hypothetical protein
MFIGRASYPLFSFLFFSRAADGLGGISMGASRRPAEKQKRGVAATVYYKHGTPLGFGQQKCSGVLNQFP